MASLIFDLKVTRFFRKSPNEQEVKRIKKTVKEGNQGPISESIKFPFFHKKNFFENKNLLLKVFFSFKHYQKNSFKITPSTQRR